MGRRGEERSCVCLSVCVEGVSVGESCLYFTLSNQHPRQLAYCFPLQRGHFPTVSLPYCNTWEIGVIFKVLSFLADLLWVSI